MTRCVVGVFILGLAVVMAGCSASHQAPARTETPTATPRTVIADPAPAAARGPVGRCRPRQIAGRTGFLGGALGTGLTKLVLTDSSVHPCRIKGYVTIALESRRHRPIHTTQSRGGVLMGVYPDPGPSQVRVSPDHPASVELGWQDNAVTVHGHQQRCRPAGYLDVTLPGVFRPIVVIPGDGTRDGPYSIAACGGHVTVTAIESGSSPTRK